MRLLFTIIVVLISPHRAHAWNALGHRVVADIAWQQLAPEQQQEIVATLRRHPRFDEDFAKKMPANVDEGRWIFQQAAVWPDIARGLQGEDRFVYDHPTWHYVNFPLFVGGERPLLGVNLSAEYPTQLDDSKWNVAQGVKHAMAALESAASPSDKALAYCWLLHLIGDLHQPMHSTALFSERFPSGDRGGNLIPVVQGGNLHSLWDGLLGRADKPNDVKRVVADLEGRQLLWEVDADGEVEEWIAESHDLAKSIAYSGEILDAVNEPDELQRINLPEAYLEEAGRRARQRVVAAGLRTAGLIKMLGSDPDQVAQTLRWSKAAEFIPQPVNQLGRYKPDGGTEVVGGKEELATVRLSVTNGGELPVRVTRGELLIDSAVTQKVEISTAAFFPQIDRTGHNKVVVENPEKGATVRFDLDEKIGPGETKDIIIWITIAKPVDFLSLNGKIRLHSGDQTLETEPLALELHR